MPSFRIERVSIMIGFGKEIVVRGPPCISKPFPNDLVAFISI